MKKSMDLGIVLTVEISSKNVVKLLPESSVGTALSALAVVPGPV